tara:strand:- start:3147 stop:3833 length:687 start_codon:yes stop_codon:yes gene_type:complete
MYENLKDRFSDISQKIQAACLKAQRSRKDVKLIAVSKLQSIEVIKEAYLLGIKNFGENYAQELEKKVLASPKDIVWHFIGPIQSNKTKLIAKHADWVHSLEREKIAKKLNDELKTEGRKIQALIQVNIDQEESKSGMSPNHVIDFANNVNANYPNLILKGLMFMPKINQSKRDKIDTMKNISALQSTFVNKFPACNVLSLGTSNDFEESILAGSTMIRIGESLLGRRS